MSAPLSRRIEVRENGGASFTGPEAVDVYRATVIAHGLKLYAKTGMRPNRMYTPKNMMAAAAQMTGQKFKARDYLKAAESLLALAHSKAVVINAEDDVAAGSQP